MPKKRDINEELAAIFYEMADLYELKKVRWKPQAYRGAAATLGSVESVSEIYKEGGSKGVDELPGVGSGITKKVVEYIKTGKIKKFEDLKKSIPGVMYEMMQIPGIGPKKATMFYEKLGIKSVADLKKAIREGKLKELPGFKERAEEKVGEGLEIAKKKIRGRISLGEAKRIAKPILTKVKKISGVSRAEVAGSLRRGKATIKDIDIVVETRVPEGVIEKFVKMPFVEKVLGKGKEKTAVIIKDGLEVDIRLIPKGSYGSCLLYFTGDKAHNIWMRRVAMKRKWKLNEYGLFEGKKQIAGKDEIGVYRKLGLKYVSPEKRIGEVK